MHPKIRWIKKNMERGIHIKSFVITVFIILQVQFSFAGRFHTLKVIENIALEMAPELSQATSRKSAFEESAIAAGRLKDPKLQVGLVNVPTDSFKLTQENMTQLKIGVMQEFPRGKTLSLKSEKQKILATRENHQYSAAQIEIIRAVRINWMELYYVLNARKILQETKEIFSHLVKVATSQLSVGKGFQHQVLRAQLELTRINDRLIKIAEDIARVRASFVRLIGENIANGLIPTELPRWSEPEIKLLQEQVKHHPQINKIKALVLAAHKDWEIAQELYKPAWSLGVVYSSRNGRATRSTKKRSDFIGLQLTTELPFFTKNSQERIVSSSFQKYQAVKNQEHIDTLNIVKELTERYALWVRLKDQEKLYKTKLIPEVKQYAQATLSAYENTKIEYETVAKAYDRKLLTSLEELRIETQKYQAHAHLLYLKGIVS
jgi:outer membrane protein TolC